MEIFLRETWMYPLLCFTPSSNKKLQDVIVNLSQYEYLINIVKYNIFIFALLLKVKQHK